LAFCFQQVVLAIDLVNLVTFLAFGRSACEEVGFVFVYLEQMFEQVLVIA
jgi:hypothetical protein